ncbi:MAG: hypothetical protein LBP25_01095 [Tannerellaceae bacterium]|jgi:hypothetical protein|nr:hypothetical protein [Tannerellaceae bacterium]
MAITFSGSDVVPANCNSVTVVTYYAESRHIAVGCRSTSRTPITITVNPCSVPVNPHLRTRVY